ncbi:MAG: hypothetical protein C0501_13385 [Isosphaera sp.]|nr:hypothetical protein [Isosphaera sp.]
MTALCLGVWCLAAQGAGPKPLHTFSVKKAGGAAVTNVQWLAFTPGGAVAVRHADPRDLLAGPADAALGAYDPATGKAVASAVVTGGGCTFRAVACAVGPDGTWIAYAADGHLKFLPLPPGKPAPPGDGAVKVPRLLGDSGVWLDPKGETAFLLDRPDFERPALREWDFGKQSGRDLVRVVDAGDEVKGRALDPRARRLAVGVRGDGGFRIDLWSLAGQPARVTVKTAFPADALAHSPDGKLVAAGFGDGSVVWYDAATGKPVRQLPPLGRFTAAAVAFHPGGKHLACGTFDGRGAANLFLIDVGSGEVLAKLTADPHGVSQVCFDATGDRLAAGGSSGAVTVWDAAALLKLRRD